MEAGDRQGSILERFLFSKGTKFRKISPNIRDMQLIL